MYRLNEKRTSEHLSLAIPRRTRMKRRAKMRIWKTTSDSVRGLEPRFGDVVSPGHI
jgi:hypothetical protein